MRARQEQVDEVRQWERDWRSTITTQVDNIAENTTQMSLVVREMQGDVKDLMKWKEDVQRRKDDGIEKRPDDKRANMALVVAAIGVMIAACGSGFSLVSYVAQHWH